jgi:hypothetical protein
MPRSWLLGGRMHFHQWKRREFITLLGGAAAWSCVAVPQGAKKRPVVGILGQGTPAQRKGVRWIQSFLDGMRKLSWIEGRSMNGLLGEERRLSWNILIDMARRPPLVPFVTNNGGRQLFLKSCSKPERPKIALVGTPCPYQKPHPGLKRDEQHVGHLETHAHPA